MARLFLALAAVYGLTAVLLGAFGAHALSARLSDPMKAVWHTAEQYQFYHALALLAVGILARSSVASATLTGAGICFVAGTAVFCASLYLLAFTGARWLGAITPIGGVVLIIGWLLFLIAMVANR